MAESSNVSYLASEKAPEQKGADFWRKEIGRSRTQWKSYRERAEKVIKRYRDERSETEIKGSKVRFNILYSNIETLRPAIFSNQPTPDIRRRFLQADPVGKISADILQKALSFLNESDMNATLGGCVQDFVLPGFAVARVKYQPLIDGDQIIEEDCPSQYVGWDHFAMSRSPTWDRVWWVAFMEELTKDEFLEAFGKEKIESASFGYRNDDDNDKEVLDASNGGKARIWEVWDKRAKQRFFIAEGGKGFVRDPEPDPLNLHDFFPCARPIWAISTTGSLIPVPEYLEYQDLAIELDDVTQRIHVLTGGLRRRGFYDGSLKDQIGNVGNLGDNQFEPVDDWARLIDKGGIERVMAEMPLQGIVGALTSLYDYRERIIQTIYQVTGMADIVRGASNPTETATAQQIKGRYAGLRLGEKQQKFQQFACDIMRLKAEIVAEHFQMETLQQISGVELLTNQQKQQFAQMQQAIAQQAQMMAQQAQATGQQPPPPPQMPPDMAKMAPLMAQPSWDDVMALLKSDKLRGFRVDVETDSTIQPNADEERQQRIDLLTSISGYLGSVAPLVQQGIVPGDLARELLLFGVRAFKTAPQVEAALEAVGQQMPETPQIQQAKQQIQAQTQQLQIREQKIVADEQAAQKKTSDSQLAAERAMRQESEAGWAKRVLDMTASFQKQMEAMQAQHDGQLRTVAQQAETAVTQVVDEMSALPVLGGGMGGGGMPMMGVKGGGMDMPKEPKAAPTNVNIRINGKDAMVEKKAKPRKMVIRDMPDGSTMLEEMMDEMMGSETNGEDVDADDPNERKD